MQRPLLIQRPGGLYCPEGDFYIDPMEKVATAVITHAHSDHARRGSGRYFCAASGVGLLRHRIGTKAPIVGVPYSQTLRLGQIQVSFHPAGHMLGSAQIRLQRADSPQSPVWVVSGDYKREPDPSCEPFEVVRCDTFITEATFGTPKYQWEKSGSHGAAIHQWWLKNAAEGFHSILFGYSIGKSQRILAELAPYAHEPVLIHDTIFLPTQLYRDEGRVLAPTEPLATLVDSPLFSTPAVDRSAQFRGRLILAPPAILKSDWASALRPYRTAFASGWMIDHAADSPVPGRDYHHGFVLSDHADWNDLLTTIAETGATQVFVQHRDGALVRHLRRQGLQAYGIHALSEENLSKLPPEQLQLFLP